MRFINKRIIPIITFFVVLSSGCNRRPEHVLSEKKTINVLTDLHLAQAYYESSQIYSSGDSARTSLALAVLKKHGVTKEDLDSTIAWYGRNMDLYTIMLGRVEKQIESKRKELLKAKGDNLPLPEGDELWPYSANALISDLSGSNSIVFSIDNPVLEKGDNIKWKLRTANIQPYVMILGVEYADGNCNFASRTLNSDRNLEITVQSDTSNTVKRLFGSLRNSSYMLNNPVWIDSISLTHFPYDSTTYRKNMMSQKELSLPMHTVEKTTADYILDRGSDTNELSISESRTTDYNKLPSKLPEKGRTTRTTIRDDKQPWKSKPQ